MGRIEETPSREVYSDIKVGIEFKVDFVSIDLWDNIWAAIIDVSS